MTQPLLNPAVATPSGLAVFALIYIGKLLNDSWRERRERKQEKEESESSIVSETKDLLIIWKQEVADLHVRVVADGQYIDTLEEENHLLRERLRNEGIDDQTADRGRSAARLRRPGTGAPWGGSTVPGPHHRSGHREAGPDAGNGEREGFEPGGATAAPQ